MHRRVRRILEICRGKRAELGCVSLKQKQVLTLLTIRKNKITSHCTSWGPLKRGCREAQHPCSSLCTLTTIHAETSKPMSPKLIPSSPGDKASLDSRSPPSSQKTQTLRSLAWRHCMSAWHGLGSVSSPFSANIAAFPCLLFPLQMQGTLRAAPPASGPPSSA